VNDTYGHDCGDEALKLVATCIQGALRESDLLARFGGEEFIVLVQQLDLYSLAKLAERVLRRIEGLEFKYAGERIPLTISAGVSVRRDMTQAYFQVIKHADVALYQAKANGRNRVEVYSE
jgi:diguanylate cyclase (GGDEF)-like protein